MVGVIEVFFATCFFASKRKNGKKQSVSEKFVKGDVLFREMCGRRRANIKFTAGVQNFDNGFLFDSRVVGNVIRCEFNGAGDGVDEMQNSKCIFICQQFEKLYDLLLLFGILQP